MSTAQHACASHLIAVVPGDAPWGGDGGAGHPDQKVTTGTRTWLVGPP
ncbi:hypothetical protein [Cutibacterium granulosum]|nr:hypothetical protein [Cutibacterium granulosum]